MDAQKLVDQFLAEKYIMQLATSVDGQPWICTVHYISDAQRNLYWASLPSRRHSQELKQNNRVAADIVVKDKQPVIHLQIAGVAEEVPVPITDRAIVEAYAAKSRRDQQWIDDFIAGKTEHRLYKLTPTGIVLFDEVNFPDNPRHELPE